MSELSSPPKAAWGTGAAAERARALLLEVASRCSKDRAAYFPDIARDIRGKYARRGIVIFGLRSPTWAENLRAIENAVAANPYLEIRALVDDEPDVIERTYASVGDRYPVLSAADFFARAGEFADCVAVDRYCTWMPGIKFKARFKQFNIPSLRLEQFLNAPALRGVGGFYRGNADFMLENVDALLRLESSWADDRSREVFYTVLAGFISMDFTFFALTCDDHRERYFPSDVGFQFGTDEVLVDCGSNEGGEIAIFADRTANRFRAVHAFEPDRENFPVLCRNMARLMSERRLDNVYCYPLGVYDRNDYLRFSGQGTVVTLSRERAAGREGVFVTRLDDIVDECSYLRLEVEGSEVPALNGAAALVRRLHPKLAVSTYHLPDDFLTIPRAILEIDAGYRMRLRHQSLEAGVLCIYAH